MFDRKYVPGGHAGRRAVGSAPPEQEQYRPGTDRQTDRQDRQTTRQTADSRQQFFRHADTQTFSLVQCGAFSLLEWMGRKPVPDLRLSPGETAAEVVHSQQRGEVPVQKNANFICKLEKKIKKMQISYLNQKNSITHTARRALSSASPGSSGGCGQWVL